MGFKFKLQAAAMGGGSIAAIVLLTICLGMDLFVIFLSIYGFLWIFTLDLLTLYQKDFLHLLLHRLVVLNIRQRAKEWI